MQDVYEQHLSRTNFEQGKKLLRWWQGAPSLGSELVENPIPTLTVATILLTAAAERSSPLGSSTSVMPMYFRLKSIPSSRVSLVSVQFSGSSKGDYNFLNKGFHWEVMQTHTSCLLYLTWVSKGAVQHITAKAVTRGTGKCTSHCILSDCYSWRPAHRALPAQRFQVSWLHSSSPTAKTAELRPVRWETLKSKMKDSQAQFLVALLDLKN